MITGRRHRTTRIQHVTAVSPDASRPRRRDDSVGCLDDLGDVVPVLLDVEVHPDPAAAADVRRPEEPARIQRDPVLLRALRRGRPERHPVVVVPVGERDELLPDEPGRLAVAEPLGHARQGQAQVANPLQRSPRWSGWRHRRQRYVDALAAAPVRASLRRRARTARLGIVQHWSTALFAVGELTWRVPVKRVRLDRRARRPGCRGADGTRLRCGVKEV